MSWQACEFEACQPHDSRFVQTSRSTVDPGSGPGPSGANVPDTVAEAAAPYAFTCKEWQIYTTSRATDTDTIRDFRRRVPATDHAV